MERNVPEAPKYESFKMARGYYGVWWMYDWKASIALGLLFIGGTGAGALAYFIFGLHGVLSFAIGLGVGIAIGFVYNFVASKNDWQKLNWLDIGFFALPEIP